MEKITHDIATLEVLNEKEGYYHEAYSEIYVHEDMLKDHVRTGTYKRAIETNKHLFKVSILLFIFRISLHRNINQNITSRIK